MNQAYRRYKIKAFLGIGWLQLVILGAMVPVAARAKSPAKPAAGGID
jgi:hypothetical protein